MSVRIKPEFVVEVDRKTTLGKIVDVFSDAADSCKNSVVESILAAAYFFGFGYSKEVDSFEQFNLKLIREAIVNRQTSEHSRQDGVFQLYPYVIRGDFTTFKEKLEEIEKHYQDNNIELEHSPIYATDAAGGTIIHIAYSYQQYDIGRYLVSRYPKLGLQPYRGTLSLEIKKENENKFEKCSESKRRQENELMPYSGENILHMTIVRRSYSEVRWLLDFYRDHKDFYCPDADAEPDPDNRNIIDHLRGRKVSSAQEGKESTVSKPPVPQAMSLKELSGIAAADQKRMGLPMLSGANAQMDDQMRSTGGSKRVYMDGLAVLLSANAHGNFFDNKGGFYFGSYPLQFAVCSNDTEIFDLVFAFVTMIDNTIQDAEFTNERQTSISGSNKSISMSRNAIFNRDCYGNTVLHLCVLHGLKEMYEHVYNTALAIVNKELRIFYASLKGKHVGESAILPADLYESDETASIEKFGYSRNHERIVIPAPSKVSLWLKDESKRIVDERLVLALNEDLHSPLTLAASLIRKNHDAKEVTERRVEMFSYLLGHLKQPLWSFGPINTALLDVAGVEFKYQLQRDYDLRGNERKLLKKEHHAAIDWLCTNDADAAITNPMVRQLIETKWERVGYPNFLVGFVIHTMVTTFLTLILIFVNATPTVRPRYVSEWFVDFLYPIVVIAFFIMFLMEINDIVPYQAYYFKFRGVARFNKFMRTLKVITFTIFCCFKVAQASKGKLDEDNSIDGATVYYDSHLNVGVKFSLTICVIASWMHLYYFFMGFDATGPFVLTIFRIVAKDVPYFINFYSIVVVAFGCALSALSNNGDYRAYYGFFHLLKAIWTLIQNTVGTDPTYDRIRVSEDVPENLVWWADVLMSLYFATVVILMLNLLIAMISETYVLYNSYNEAILLIEKYNIMHAMEKAMSKKEQIEYRKRYHANIMRPDPVDKYGAGNMKSEQVTLASNSSGRRGSNFRAPAMSRQKSASHRHFVTADDAPSGEQTMQNKFEVQSVNTEWWSKAQIDKDWVEDSNTSGFLDGTKKTTLFIIDPQVDFHPEGGGEPGDPLYHPQGSLAVLNANEDTHRIAEMIDCYGHYIHEIFVSMDSHYPCHIAHAVSWVDPKGNPPEPFTIISHDDIKAGKWRPRDDSKSNMDWVLEYIQALERKKKFMLCIWPEHCIVGSQGHCVVPELNAALQRWALRQQRPVQYVMKGQNLRTEMYSALEAEVEDPNDPNTTLNSTLVAMLKVSDRLLVCGQAMSHCVNYTMRDIMTHWDDAMSDLFLLKDGASPVFSFEKEAEDFINHCKGKGVTVCRIANVFDERKGYKPAEGTRYRADKLVDDAVKAEKAELALEKLKEQEALQLLKTPKHMETEGTHALKHKSAEDDVSKSSIESITL